MKNFSFIILLFLTMGCCQQELSPIQYPVTQKVDTIDTYFGVKVADPYRWLECDTSEQTAQWVEAQNSVTFEYLSKIPFRQKISERLTKIWNFAKMSTPFFKGGKYFFYKNDGLQNQPVFYVQENFESEAKILIDPNTLAEDGTVAINSMDISNDGKYIAYSIAKSGSDWNEIFVKEIATGKELSDHLKWVKFSGISFYNDGFFYSRYDAPEEGKELSKLNTNHKVYYHKIGDNQKNDILIYQNPAFPKRNYLAYTTNDEKYLLLYEVQSTQGNALYFKETKNFNSPFIKLAEGFNYEYRPIDNIGDELFIYTNENAPRYRLMKANLKNLKQPWKEVIPEKNEVLQSCILVGDKIAVIYMKDAYNKIELYNYDGSWFGNIELPGIGTTEITGKKGSPLLFYSFVSFTAANEIYTYDLTTKKSTLYFKPTIDFNTEEYITKQIFYTSKDGTKIPMFIIHKKDIKFNGNNPTLLYGYGGFNISLTPEFRIDRLLWLENGGVYAVANIRGGGEYGEKWHKAGTKENKQNVFDDFIAAAEYLINEKFTSPKKLAITGGSNGGLLVGACINQHPELFKVAIPQVGVMDMLRFHKFTIGWSWTGDYGSSDDSAMFNVLYKYSPLHNIRENVEYPAVLVITADHDDRVVPAHSFKYIATLQEKYKGNNPVLIRIEKKAGHGAGKPTSKRIESAADFYSFIFYNLGITPLF